MCPKTHWEEVVYLNPLNLTKKWCCCAKCCKKKKGDGGKILECCVFLFSTVKDVQADFITESGM